MVINFFKLMWWGMLLGGVICAAHDFSWLQIALVALVSATLIFGAVLLLAIFFPKVVSWSKSTSFIDLTEVQKP